MKEITTTELKTIQLEILDEISAFCQLHKLRYYLAYGTLIGAVRHKGYIPWDDDIDIAMPRDDYEFLIANFVSNRYKVKDYRMDNNYSIPFAKVYDKNTILIENSTSHFEIGVNIDIFPLDGLSSDINKAKKLLWKIMFYSNMSVMKSINYSSTRAWWKNVFMYLCRLPLFFISFKWLSSKMNLFAMQNHFDTSDWVANCLMSYGICEISRKEIFSDVIKLEFEGRNYLAPKGYDEWLTNIYGDYMKLPPKEKQVTHHSFVAYWK